MVAQLGEHLPKEQSVVGSISRLYTLLKTSHAVLLSSAFQKVSARCAMTRKKQMGCNKWSSTFNDLGLGQHISCTGYKWKNHFYEMKGDVGMSLHEKGRNKKMPTPRHKVTHNPIPTSLFCFNMLFVCLH